MALRCKKVCFFYFIMSVLFGIMICNLVISHFEHGRQIQNLRMDFNNLMQKKLGFHCKNEGVSDEKLTENSALQQLSALIDRILKKKLSGIWDDLFHLKQQVKTLDCTKQDLDNNNSLMKPKPEPVNYADEDLGACIIEVNAEPVGGTSFVRRLFNLEFSANQPINMLKSSMNPGNCFGFEGETASVTIQLGRRIIMDSILIEHISDFNSPDKNTKSAPKKFILYGIKCFQEQRHILIGEFVYNNCPEQLAQIFTIKFDIPVVGLYIEFKSNHGHPRFTCVYRLAVYGEPQAL